MATYEQNVFINCPFDAEYDELFNAILFTVHRCGFVLRCSKEFQDTSSVRIANIMSLIDESLYSIHDLSRVNFDEENELPRFNMPLELGVFMGCKHWGSKKHKSKTYLIIESQKFRFKQFISDISGQDIKSHEDDPQKVVTCIRNWLATKTNETIPSPTNIWKQYNDFKERLPDLCLESEWEVNELTFAEYSSLVTSWLALST